MSSLVRMLGVLDLFTEHAPTWSPDAIAGRLGCSLPTAYRYVRALAQAGLLRRASAGSYVLGPRLAELDFQMQRTDPLLGSPALDALADELGLDVVVAEALGRSLLTVHRVAGREGITLTHGRGRRLPPFRGALSKVVLAWMPRAALRRFHAAQDDAPDLDELVANTKETRAAGYAISRGEIDPGLVAVAVPLHRPDGAGVAALGVAMSERRFAAADFGVLLGRMRLAAESARSALAHAEMVIA